MQTLQENSDAEKDSCNVAARSDEEFDSVVSEKANSASEKVNMNRVILMNQISEGKQAHAFDSMDKCDIFSLTKDSLLFSQISKNEIVSLKEENMTNNEFNDTCHMVELKECEVLTPIVIGTEPYEDLVTLQHGIEYHPSPVEIVELIETDMDGDECMEEDEGEYDVELSPCFSRKEKEIGVLHTSSKNSHSVLLEMTDRINRTEEAKITAHSSSKIYDVDVHKFKETLKEVKFKKEIEVSRTYQIVGNFNKSEEIESAADECSSFSDSDKEADDVIIFSEDDESNKKYIEDSSSSTDDLYDVYPKSPEQHVIEVGL